MIGDKILHAIQCGLKVIACIGEKLSDRENGHTEEVVHKQLQAISGMKL